MTLFTHGHALIIGAGGDLPNTVDDATGLANLLKDPGRCAYPPAQVEVLTGPQATRSAILAGLAALRDRAGEDATVIVYFSGHGYEVKTGIGKQTFLMPHGYQTGDLHGTAVSGRELADALRAIRTRKLLLLLDCCHAGGLDDVKVPGSVTFTKAPMPAEAVELMAAGSGRASIASCKRGELSYAGRPYSAFTLALLEALCGQGAARDDGFVRVTDLALHTRQMVPGRTRDRQHPILHYEQGDNFRVAYYAAGDTTPKEPPFPPDVNIEPYPGEQRGISVTTTTNYHATASGGSAIVQGGGIAVAGRGVVNTGKVGGHIVTGDHNVVAGRDASAGISPAELDRLFAPILDAIAALPAGQQPAAVHLVEDLKAEVTKEDKADDNRMARIIDGLAGLVPSAVAGLVSAFAHPILSAMVGPVTQAVLGRIGQ